VDMNCLPSVEEQPQAALQVRKGRIPLRRAHARKGHIDIEWRRRERVSDLNLHRPGEGLAWHALERSRVWKIERLPPEHVPGLPDQQAEVLAVELQVDVSRAHGGIAEQLGLVEWRRVVAEEIEFHERRWADAPEFRSGEPQAHPRAANAEINAIVPGRKASGSRDRGAHGGVVEALGAVVNRVGLKVAAQG